MVSAAAKCVGGSSLASSCTRSSGQDLRILRPPCYISSLLILVSRAQRPGGAVAVEMRVANNYQANMHVMHDRAVCSEQQNRGANTLSQRHCAAYPTPLTKRNLIPTVGYPLSASTDFTWWGCMQCGTSRASDEAAAGPRGQSYSRHFLAWPRTHRHAPASSIHAHAFAPSPRFYCAC